LQLLPEDVDKEEVDSVVTGKFDAEYDAVEVTGGGVSVAALQLLQDNIQ
jgi:hypothetical protein